MTQTLFDVLLRLWKHLSIRRRRQVKLLLVLMVISAAAEVITLGAILPFLAVLVSPDRLWARPAIAGVAQMFGVASAEQLVFPLIVVFAIVALVAGAIRLLVLWANTKVAFSAGVDLSSSIYERTLYQPYYLHTMRNTSEVISGIVNDVKVTLNVLFQCLNLISSLLILVAVVGALLIIDLELSLIALAGFGSGYGLIIWLSRRRLDRNSIRVVQEQVKLLKALQEGLGGIRDVLLDGTQSVYCGIYRRADTLVRRAEAENMFIATSPRFAMEAVGMILIAAIAYSASRQFGGIAAAIPTLGAFTLGAQRLLPCLQQLYGAWSGIVAHKGAMASVLELLDQPLPELATASILPPVAFKDTIQIEAISFRYRDTSPWVLKDIDISVKKGARIGFIGRTGSGKSTALDILMGLLSPQQGRVLVDGVPIDETNRRSWQQIVAHVPQSIFLADTSIAENIAFGVLPQDIDMNRVMQAARQAQIGAFIEAQPESYSTPVGERGIRLSGGQRQRIGIARALYKQASVLIFDEATSALDTETEQAVMDAIGCLDHNMTVLIIAHRLSTLRSCDQIIVIGEGRVIAQGTYTELFEGSSKSRVPLAALDDAVSRQH